MNWRNKLVGKVFDSLLSVGNASVNVENAKEKYHREGGQKVLIKLTDVEYSKSFEFDGEKLRALNDGVEPDVVVSTTSQTIFNIVKGSVKVRYPSGLITTEPYTPKTAFLHGKITVEGKVGMLSDVQVLDEVFKDVAKEISPKIGLLLG